VLQRVFPQAVPDRVFLVHKAFRALLQRVRGHWVTRFRPLHIKSRNLNPNSTMTKGEAIREFVKRFQEIPTDWVQIVAEFKTRISPVPDVGHDVSYR
jgi:hypothetical protein